MVSTRSLLALSLAYLGQAVSAQSNFSLYAYGKGIEPGLQLVFGDGKAYVGPNAPSFVSEAANITLSQDGDETEFIAHPNRTIDGFTRPTLYIDLNAGTNDPIGFVGDNEKLPPGVAVTGFGLYGGWAFHRTNGEPIAMKFLASPTNETNVYLVKWDAGATKADGEIPISLRTLAPVPITT